MADLTLVSFDIDGTLAVGEPPGPISFDMVREAIRRGHIVGSASDRTVLEQERMWATAGIDVAFMTHKHHLESVRDRFGCARHIHIGDTGVDAFYARLAGFEFFDVDALPSPLTPGWVY